MRGLARVLRRRPLVIETLDGVPARASPLYAPMLAAGLEPEYKGLRLDLA